MKAIEGSITAPKGYIGAGIKAGLKKSGKEDVALLVSEVPAAVGAVAEPSYVISTAKPAGSVCAVATRGVPSNVCAKPASDTVAGNLQPVQETSSKVMAPAFTLLENASVNSPATSIGPLVQVWTEPSPPEIVPI